MRYLIDSDVVIDYFEEREPVVSLLNRLSQDGLAIGVVTYMEVYQGLLRGTNADNLRARFDAFLAVTPILSFSPDVARQCAHLRENLRLHGQRVRARYLDLINAATAIEYDLIPVTRNVDDYDDIPGLLLA